MFQSHFEELVSFPLLHKSLCHVPTIFVLLGFCLQIPLTCIFPSAISYLPNVRHRHCGPVTLSILKINANKHLLFCNWESSGSSKRNKWVLTLSAPCCVLVLPSARGSSQHNSWSYRQGSVAVVGFMSRVSVEIQLNLCPCNVRHVAICKMLNSSNHRNTYNHNLFLWKTLHFNFCSSVIQLSPELGTCVACES